MKPIVIPETNAVFKLGGCGDLPASKASDENGQNYIISAWEISPEELKLLNETGILYLSVVGTGIPPVLLTVQNPFEGGKSDGSYDDSGEG